MGDYASQRSGAFEDAAYLTRSENRVRILEALAAEPYSRRDLVDATGASSTTAGRVLSELQSRGWVERTGDGYEATPTGVQVAAEFEPFIRAMETIRHLGDAVGWIPTDDLAVELHQFGDATVRRPERRDPAEAVDFFVDLLRDAGRFRALTHLVPIEMKEAIMLDGVRTGRLEAVVVLTDDLVEYLREHSTHRRRWEELLDAGADVSRYDGRIPCNLFVLDDVVILGDAHPDSGHPYAFLVSENPTVRSASVEMIDRYRDDAEPVVAPFAGEG